MNRFNAFDVRDCISRAIYEHNSGLLSDLKSKKISWDDYLRLSFPVGAQKVMNAAIAEAFTMRLQDAD